MSVKSSVYLLAAASTLSSNAASGRRKFNLNLVRRALQSGLDNELNRIEIAEQHGSAEELGTMHSKRNKKYIRGVVEHDSELHEAKSTGDTSHILEQLWGELVEHAWTTVRQETHWATSRFPFLVCREKDDKSIQDTLDMFHKEESSGVMLVSSIHNMTQQCLVLTTTATQANQVENDGSLEILPLLDILKIQPFTIDEVSSKEYGPPFIEHSGHVSDNILLKNESERINQWERTIAVDLVPGLNLKEESMLLDAVNTLISDLEDMAEVGWLKRMDKREAQEYVMDEKLVGTPALFDAFSLTSLSAKNNLLPRKFLSAKNARLEFWHQMFANGMESEHACEEMFSTLFVKPKAGYESFDLVLNPNDGPPPSEYKSSASNPACLTSLVAALSTNPHVLSVKADFPAFIGWNLAQHLESR